MELKAWFRLCCCSSSSLVSVLSADGDDRMLEHPLAEERLVARLEELLLLEPEVRRLGVKRLIKSSMVFTGDFNSNLRRTWTRTRARPGTKYDTGKFKNKFKRMSHTHTLSVCGPHLVSRLVR